MCDSGSFHVPGHCPTPGDFAPLAPQGGGDRAAVIEECAKDCAQAPMLRDACHAALDALMWEATFRGGTTDPEQAAVRAKAKRVLRRALGLCEEAS